MDNTVYIRWGLNLMELLACITGFIYRKKMYPSYWKWFPVYLAVIVCTELTAKYVRDVLDNVAWNFAIYTYFGIPLQFFFFFWLFGHFYRHTPVRHWPTITAICYAASWITDFIYFRDMKTWFFSFSYSIGNIMLLVLIITFFVRLVRDDETLQFKSNLMFWVCLGLSLFYLGTMPYYGLRNTLRADYPNIFRIYWYIQLCLSYLMYISFTLGFIWSKPK